jgi:putative hydrolase of the HAD superfamily
MILTNGLISKIKQSLSVLGISPELFELIGSSEITGTNKPDPQAFTFMIGKTGFAAASCLMVGDRDEVDIIPAKAAGMKTCFVWGKSRIADLSLPRVYDLPGYLG